MWASAIRDDQAVDGEEPRALTGFGRAPRRFILLIAIAVALLVGVILTLVATMTNTPPKANSPTQYPWHTNIVATTFWVGEVFDPNTTDGSQLISAYDRAWYDSYGGCDGVVAGGTCQTERRTADNGYFPRHMTPRENPFYLDLPFDDVNDPTAFAMRGEVIPWAGEAEYRDRIDDRHFSLMKNRWVRLEANGRTCYGQVQDAGPGEYHDSEYVFGDNDARPANKRFNNSGLDVSPALNGCLRFKDLNGQHDVVNWQFVDFEDVPDGPWRQLVTTSGVSR